MKIKSLLLALLFAFATTAFGETVTVYQTNFDDLPGANAIEPSEYSNLIASSTNLYPEDLTSGGRALRLGSSSARGSFTSIEMNCTPNAPITFTFDVARHNDAVNNTIRITINGVSRDILPTEFPTLLADSFTTGLSVTFEDGVPTSTFTFTMETVGGAAAKARTYFDNLVITQDIVESETPADPVQLAAPAGIAAEVTYESATVSWKEVENATKYSVIFVNGETETEYETTETSITFENLIAETVYSVKVAAVGDDVSYLTSEYSTASFTTEAAPEGEWKVLFYDDFSLLTTGDHTSTSNNGKLTKANAPWAKLDVEGVDGDYYKVNQAGGAVKFSTGTEQGFVTTTNITFQALKTRITAYVKGWNEKDGTPASFDVVINGQTYSAEPFPQAYITSDFAEVVIEIPSVTAGSFPVKITSTNGDDYRFFLDSFKIEQFVLSTLGVLPAPTSVEAVAQTPYSVKVDWSAVTGAASYTITLEMVDEEGNPVGTSIAKSAGYTETSIVVDGLADGAKYNVSVVAVGDGAASLDSVAATTTVTTPADTYKPVFTITDAAGKAMDAFEAPKDDPIVIMASAMVGEEVASVTANNLPEGATFVDGVLTWTPSLEMEANTVFTVDFVVTNEGGTYTTSVTITVAEALPLVVGEITASDITATAATLSWDALPKASSYVYDIWYGSSVITNGVEIESFFDFEGVRKGVIPYDVTINGANGTYADNKDFDFEHNVVCFNDDTGYVITKAYPKAVTTLSAYFVKNNAKTEEGLTGNPVTVYASSDDGATWVQIESYAAADLAADEIRVFEFDAALNYTRFKFEWQQVEMNFGISAIAATYAGAGAKVFAQDQTTTDTSISLPKGLRANTEYYVRIKPVNETRECAYKYIRFVTGKADPATYIIVR
ncbi:MAG: fibronectin type III domain-containing protein [Kiritimatiellae bacterium]|nr:fibronectin type III domain-containing protein [Kiritimatiellia bacterium]